MHPEKGMLITSFKDLQIINGGQTTATLAATNIKYNADLSGIFIQMKLKEWQKHQQKKSWESVAKLVSMQH